LATSRLIKGAVDALPARPRVGREWSVRPQPFTPMTPDRQRRGLAKAGEEAISRYHTGNIFMAQLVVRNLDDDVKAKLQQRARQHGRSTEEEVREILRNAVRNEPQGTEPLGKRLRALFDKIGLEEDILEWSGQPAEPATFG
jgi:antitoxin FitA